VFALADNANERPKQGNLCATHLPETQVIFFISDFNIKPSRKIRSTCVNR